MSIRQVNRYWILVAVVGIMSVLLAAGCSESEKLDSGTDTQTTGKVRYVLKFVKGLSYEIRVVSDKKGGGGKISGQISTGLGYRFDVNSVDDQGNALVDCTVNWVKFKKKCHGGIPENQDVNYDSSDENLQVIPELHDSGDIAFFFARTMRAFLEEKFTAKITPRGQVQEIRGLDTLRKNMVKKLAGRGPSVQDLTGAKLTLMLKTLFLHPLAIYPEQPVGVGDSWAVTEVIQEGFEYENTWTLKGRKDGVATIEVNQIIKCKELTEVVGFSNYCRGQIEINESTGQILCSKTSQEISSQKEGKVCTVTIFEMTKPPTDTN